MPLLGAAYARKAVQRGRHCGAVLAIVVAAGVAAVRLKRSRHQRPHPFNHPGLQNAMASSGERPSA